MKVRRAKKSEFPLVFTMAKKLWPDVKKTDIFIPKHTFYVAEENNELVGFMMLNLRRDYVQGSSSSPVAYVEGLFVESKLRKHGVGRLLIQAAEQWAFKKGLRELGSDVLPNNKVSQDFHSRVGFKKQELIVPYIKKLKRPALRKADL